MLKLKSIFLLKMIRNSACKCVQYKNWKKFFFFFQVMNSTKFLVDTL